MQFQNDLVDTATYVIQYFLLRKPHDRPASPAQNIVPEPVTPVPWNMPGCTVTFNGKPFTGKREVYDEPAARGELEFELYPPAHQLIMQYLLEARLPVLLQLVQI